MRFAFGAAFLAVGVALFLWIRRSRKAKRPHRQRGYAIVDKDRLAAGPYPYMYVNADGSARELHPEEREYLEAPFYPADGARPHVKSSYPEKNGWGEVTGFLKRSQLPGAIVVHAAPAGNPSKPLTRPEQIQFLRDKGMVVTENPDGTFTVRNPKAGL